MSLISKITRTEVFFTASLYFAAKAHPEIITKFLKDKFEDYTLKEGKKKLADDATLIDSGFEVCFFRDFSHKSLSEKWVDGQYNRKRLKQTFDNVFLFSDGTLIIIEAKAHQRYSPDQITALTEACAEIAKGNLRNFDEQKIFLFGLHSSNYSPMEKTTEPFDGTFTWSELSCLFPDFREEFSRANEIFDN